MLFVNSLSMGGLYSPIKEYYRFLRLLTVIMLLFV
jgi:hypothetical protein